MPEQSCPKLDVDAVRRMGEDVSAQARQQAFEDRDRDEAEHENVERRKSAVHEHLVDDDLEE